MPKIVNIPVRKGSSEYHIIGTIKSLTPFSKSKLWAGFENIKSKHIKWPNVTLKSVVNISSSGTEVVFIADSPNKCVFL